MMDTVEVIQADKDALRAAWDEYASWMGDPDGNDDTEHAFDKAAEIIARHRLASRPTPAGDMEAIARLRRYVQMRTEQPLRQAGDSIHGIHIGTEWEAELTLSDLRAALEALSGEGEHDDYRRRVYEQIRSGASQENTVLDRDLSGEGERAKIVAWLAIETAPKDGTWVLLRGRNSAGFPMVPVVCAFRTGVNGDGLRVWRDSASGRDMTHLIADVPQGHFADWAPLPSQHEGEGERAKIVAWLRDDPIDFGTSEYPDWAISGKIADAIERGDFLFLHSRGMDDV